MRDGVLATVGSCGASGERDRVHQHTGGAEQAPRHHVEASGERSTPARHSGGLRRSLAAAITTFRWVKVAVGGHRDIQVGQGRWRQPSRHSGGSRSLAAAITTFRWVKVAGGGHRDIQVGHGRWRRPLRPVRLSEVATFLRPSEAVCH